MPAPSASFYFDLASPLSYIVAERILHELPAAAEWQPVLAADLPAAERSDAVHAGEAQDTLRAQLVLRAAELGLQPLRWPDPFPFDSTLAMRVATYAKSIGRVVPFAQAAFRQAFAGGRSLAASDHVLIAAAACEMHPAAVLAGAELRSVADRLAETTTAASEIGILYVPAILVGERVFLGERLLEDASSHMASAIATAGPR